MACQAGLQPDVFWEITPWQARMFIRAHVDNIKVDQQNRAWLAWHCAYLPRTKQPIPLEKLMGIRKHLSPQALRAKLRAQFAAHNQKFKKEKKDA